MTTAPTRDMTSLVYHPDSFSRLDEEPDQKFYASPRLVTHVDEAARQTIRDIIRTLVTETAPAMLDLMASWDSHVPEDIGPARLVGLGMNAAELEANRALTERVVLDLARTSTLPFEDQAFDVVLNTVSVDYLTRPFEVFEQVGRVLKPGGLHLVLFSNRMFPSKAVRIWREASEEERVFIVEDYFRATSAFGPVDRFVSKGRPRAADDKYAGVARQGDPVYAVWADKRGGRRDRPRPRPVGHEAGMPSPEVVGERKRRAGQTLCCPYCEQRMRRWQPPLSPFSAWDADHMYLCMNDACPYVQRGWATLGRQGISSTYRPAYDPARDTFVPLPVPSLRALEDGLVDEGEPGVTDG